MGVLKDLEPALVLKYFEALCDLPHGSRNTKIISDYCAVFARVRGLECRQDKANNVIIRKPATPGYEDHPTVILQGHLDMVCEKDPGVEIDFQRDGLTLRVEDGYIKASGTTLGGDDGIAVAYCLAILDSHNLQHPPLEVVLTTDEEIGMLGAAALDTSDLRGRTMINIDSEDEGILTVSCAGGVKSTISLPLKRERMTGTALTVELTGFVGGHSGTEINGGHANAILAIYDLFRRLSGETAGLRIADYTGGGKDNAIPRTATLRALTAEAVDPDRIGALLTAFAEEIRATEPDAAITLRREENATLFVLTQETQERLSALLAACPNGVQKMSEDIPGLVQTSLNLGILSTNRENLRMVFALRSSVDRERLALAARLKDAAGTVGARYEENGAYPAWEYRRDSRLRDTMQQVYRRLYGGECRVEAIHAGLECGLFAGKLPGLDCVSFGPDMLDIHTPREALSVASVERTWQFLLETLKAL